jgi:hypothetical protein
MRRAGLRIVSLAMPKGPTQPRDGARHCRRASTPYDGRHGVYCCVFVVVTVVAGAGTEVVVVRCVLVVCVVESDPQAASNVMAPMSVVANNS